MIKVIYCISKKRGLSDDEFFRYWERVHGPLGARIPRLRRLVQCHRINVPGDKRAPDYDGVAELWFDDVDDLCWVGPTPAFAALAERLDWKAAGNLAAIQTASSQPFR